MQLFALARGDAAYHWREAQQILDDDFGLRGIAPWKAPGYSYYLAALMQLVGRGPDALRWPNAVLGALNCALLVLLAVRALSWRWATLAGLLAATNGLMILYDGELFFPTLLVSLNLGALLLLSGGARSPRRVFGAGLLLGCAALVHAVYLLPFGALLLWLLGRDRQIRMPAALLGGALVAIVPVSLQNLMLRGEAVLISGNGGVNVYIGNQPGFEQTGGQRTSAWDRVVNTPVDAGLDELSAQDRFFLRAALSEAMGDPIRQMGILGRKLRAIVSPIEIANNFRLYELREHSSVLAWTLWRRGPVAFPWLVVGPLGLVGVLWMVHRQKLLGAALATWMLGLVLSFLLAFVTARYRAPLSFFLSIGVAALLSAVSWNWRRGDRKTSLRWGGAAALATVVSLLLAAEQQQLPPPIEWSQAQVVEVEGRRRAAAEWFERALRKHPEEPVLLFEKAAFHARGAEREIERALLRRVLEWPDLEPDMSLLSWERLARSHLAQGQLKSAEHAARSALELDIEHALHRGERFFALPGPPVTSCRLRLLLADILARQGARQEARALVDQVALECGPHGRLRQPLRELEMRLRSSP
jgi:tetratricopeptide (TPR) repeat protein